MIFQELAPNPTTIRDVNQMEGNIELILFFREFGSVAVPKILLRIRLTLRGLLPPTRSEATLEDVG
jgi:hypothetical protein